MSKYQEQQWAPNMHQVKLSFLWVCWRYIDVIFMIHPHTSEELYSFIKTLNKVHVSIKFTLDISQTQVNFLEVTVFKDAD